MEKKGNDTRKHQIAVEFRTSSFRNNQKPKFNLAIVTP